MAEFESLVIRMIKVLNLVDLKYVIVGGFAAIFRGRPRTTMDVDIIIEKDLKKIYEVIKILEKKDFDINEKTIQIAINDGTNVSIFDKRSVLRIDMKIASSSDEFEVLKNAIPENYKDNKIMIASVEQILYGKILYLGDISDISDEEFLEFNDILDFINVYQRASSIDIKWLYSKVRKKELESTLDRLLEYMRKQNLLERN